MRPAEPASAAGELAGPLQALAGHEREPVAEERGDRGLVDLRADPVHRLLRRRRGRQSKRAPSLIWRDSVDDASNENLSRTPGCAASHAGAVSRSSLAEGRRRRDQHFGLGWRGGLRALAARPAANRAASEAKRRITSRRRITWSR